MKNKGLITCVGLITCLSVTPGSLAAQQDTAGVELQQLKREMEAQRKLIEAQQRRIEHLEALAARGRGVVAAAPVAPAAPAPSTTQPDTAPTQVGKPPDTSRPPEVPALVDIRGVLTPRNTLIVEPSVQYSHSSNNRVALVGFSVIPAITIGLIDVRRVSRDTFIGAVSARYGLTNRFEVEAKVPYVYRHETTLSRPFATPSVADSAFEASGSGLGDIEL